MKSLARNYAYWSGMDHDIEEMVRICGPCAQAAKNPLKATLQTWPPATKPLDYIHIDFAGPYLGRHFLVIVDAYSKYPEVILAPNTTSPQTLAILRKLCAQHGFPEKSLVTMGCSLPHTNSGSSARLAAINHVLSPPYHPQSNGRAERFVDSFKRVFSN
jgi:hypothetical protein